MGGLGGLPWRCIITTCSHDSWCGLTLPGSCANFSGPRAQCESFSYARHMAEQKKNTSAFTDAERNAMKERAREAREFKKLSGEEQVSRKIAEMTPAEQKMATAIHALVMGVSPEITTKTWYGMPAYYMNDKVICFFQPGSKFDSRYSTFGFQEAAKLDDGVFWATSFALLEMNNSVKESITRLVTQAIS